MSSICYVIRAEEFHRRWPGNVFSRNSVNYALMLQSETIILQKRVFKKCMRLNTKSFEYKMPIFLKVCTIRQVKVSHYIACNTVSGLHSF